LHIKGPINGEAFSPLSVHKSKDALFPVTSSLDT
jgi:hypothetical protein